MIHGRIIDHLIYITIRVRCNLKVKTFVWYSPYYLKHGECICSMYCNGDIITSYEGIMFECLSDFKVIRISEDMLLDALRKTIFNANKGCKILLNLFYHQPIYVGDGCVEYNCIELKCNDHEEKIFLSIQNLVPNVWLSWMQLLDIL